MCGRYYIASEDADEMIRALIDEMNRREQKKTDGKSVKTGEIFPGDEALVVANSRAQNVRPFLMNWGFSMDRQLLINARSESAGEKPMFRELFHERRLIVPASGYFEWEKQGKTRVKYALTTEENAVFMAGLYRMNGEKPEFVILTRDAAEGIQFIHNRMPVIFSYEAAQAWLNRESDPQNVLKLAMEDMRFRPAV